ncbi:MAG: hypothetical protein Q9224_005324, partial [Gallowayella concinna]
MFASYPPILVLLLLNVVYFVSSVPTTHNSTLIVRGDDDLPPEFLPVRQDDGLPSGKPEEALQDYDFTFDLEDLKTCPDFDPSQEDEDEEETDHTTDLQKKDDSTKNRLTKREPGSGTTKVLRAVAVNGKKYRQAFLRSSDKTWVAVRSSGPRRKTKPVGIFETPDELPKVRNKEPWGQWQADHVCDLGIPVYIAKGDAPPGVKEPAWETVRDAILGTQVEERPDLYGKARRSHVWGVLKEMIQTQKQFDDVVKRAATVTSNFIIDDPDSQRAVLKYLQDEPGKLRKIAIDRLALDLTDPPPKNKKDSFFHIEDTSCTKDSPNKPKDEKAPKDDKSTQDVKSVPEEAPDALK